MRVTGSAALSCALVVWAICAVFNSGRVEAVGPAVGTGSELITLASPLGDFGQQLIVIDPKVRSLSVYHIVGATGEVSLKSVRNIQWDLQLSHFNNVGLTPQEIRSLLEQPTTSVGR